MEIAQQQNQLDSHLNDNRVEQIILSFWDEDISLIEALHELKQIFTDEVDLHLATRKLLSKHEG